MRGGEVSEEEAEVFNDDNEGSGLVGDGPG